MAACKGETKHCFCLLCVQQLTLYYILFNCITDHISLLYCMYFVLLVYMLEIIKLSVHL